MTETTQRNSEAIQWDGNSDTANAFIGEAYGVDWIYANDGSPAIIIALHGDSMRVEEGDWIVRSADGNLRVDQDWPGCSI